MSPENTKNELDKQIPLELHLLARTAKTIPVDDPRVAEIQAKDGKGGHDQYRNNFFVNFEALQRLIKNGKLEEGDLLGRSYLENFNERGIDPREFYNENKELCDTIFKALDGTDEYDKLLGAFIKFYNNRRFELGDRLNEMVPHPLGIEAVGVYSWDKLNPLLKKVDEAMKAMGIDTKDMGR